MFEAAILPLTTTIRKNTMSEYKMNKKPGRLDKYTTFKITKAKVIELIFSRIAPKDSEDPSDFSFTISSVDPDAIESFIVRGGEVLFADAMRILSYVAVLKKLDNKAKLEYSQKLLEATHVRLRGVGNALGLRTHQHECKCGEKLKPDQHGPCEACREEAALASSMTQMLKEAMGMPHGKPSTLN